MTDRDDLKLYIDTVYDTNYSNLVTKLKNQRIKI